MKLKIFNTALTVIMVIATLGRGYAQQQGSSTTDTAYHTKMRDLQKQMGDLQKQMSTLRTEESRKRAEEMRARMKQQSEQISKSIQTQVSANNYDRNYSTDKGIEEGIKNGSVKQVIKSYSKTYNIDNNDMVSIENQFGNVTINTWNKNEVKVDVMVQGMADQQDLAQQILDGITISDSKDNDGVSFKTNFAHERNNDDRHYKVHSMVVNYTVYMPAKNPLKIKNQFGKTEIPDFDGKLTITNQFGSFVGKNFTNNANSIKNGFMSTKIGTLNGGDLKVEHGSLELGSADNVNLNVQFSPAKIGIYRGSGNISLNFASGFDIANLDKNVKSLTINSNFSSLTLGITKDANLNFDVTVQHGSFNYGDNKVNITSKTPADSDRGYSFTKSYKGNIGKGDSDKLITIKSNMGSVNFN